MRLTKLLAYTVITARLVVKHLRRSTLATGFVQIQKYNRETREYILVACKIITCSLN